MATIAVAANGETDAARSQTRGRLFERLVARILQLYGYRLTGSPSVNHAGTEIDVEAEQIISGVPLYVECKCYQSDVDTPHVQKFIGKLLPRWTRNRKSTGLFVALPGLNSYAHGYLAELEEGEIPVKVLEAEHVLQLLIDSGDVCSPKIVAQKVEKIHGSAGDAILLYIEEGYCWVQFVIPDGAMLPNAYMLFTGTGESITDKEAVESVAKRLPLLAPFRPVLQTKHTPHSISAPQDTGEQIVAVRGSTSCFEYQFPAAPEYFVGRELAVASVTSFIQEVVSGKTGQRGLSFEANSGWGKSSLVLATNERLREIGHHAIAVDCRTASSSQFILRVVQYSLQRLSETDPEIAKFLAGRPLTGFEGAFTTLCEVGDILRAREKALIIVLDQFENVFLTPEALQPLRALFLRVCDARTNVILGFAWKSDLFGMLNEFPYETRDIILAGSRRLFVPRFSEAETGRMLDLLKADLDGKMRADLRFLIAASSQGLPWLLKKLCAHVKAQWQKGVRQKDIASNLLNVEDLFKADLQGLTAEQNETLHRIAKLAPISGSEMGDEFNPDVVQSLLHNRLLVQVGSRYDVYWDIFRDYLNTGKLPAQEHYLPRYSPRVIIRTTRALVDAGGRMDSEAFHARTGLDEGSYLNTARDLRVLQLARLEKGVLVLQPKLPAGQAAFEDAIANHLRERMSRNQLVSFLLSELKAKQLLTVEEVADLLPTWAPYIQASKETWRQYASRLANYLDYTGIAIYDRRGDSLAIDSMAAESRPRHTVRGRRRGAYAIPAIQFRAALRVLTDLVSGSEANLDDRVPMAESTRAKALASLEDTGLITRTIHAATALPAGRAIVERPSERAELLSAALRRLPVFVALEQIMRNNEENGMTVRELGLAVRSNLNEGWADSTAETNAKILLDWARAANIAPGKFAKRALVREAV